MNWIITRTTGSTVRYRASNGHLSGARDRAEPFPSASAALEAAHVGDVIVQDVDARKADQENPPEGWEECGQCDCWHPPGYTGDCRDDSNRWPA